MFEKLEEKLSQLKNSIKSSTTNFTENINLNSKIDDAKKEIAGCYGDIGEKFYSENKDAVPEGYEEYFTKIGAAFARIDESAALLKKNAGIRECPNCGADVGKGYRFCIHCGTKMPEEEVPVSDKVICEKCGVEAEEGAAFCINCGAKLPQIKEKKPEPHCERCGAKLEEGALFCTTCGLKVEIPEVPEEEVPDEVEAAAETVEETAEAVEEIAEEAAEEVQEAAEEVKEAIE